MKLKETDPEVEAISVAYQVIRQVTDAESQKRIIKYVCSRLGFEVQIKDMDQKDL